MREMYDCKEQFCRVQARRQSKRQRKKKVRFFHRCLASKIDESIVIMSPGLNLEDAPNSPERAPRPTLTRAGALRLTRQLSPPSEARRVMFLPSPTSPRSVPEHEEAEFSPSETKQEVHVDEESPSAQDEYETRRRLRTYSGGSLVTVEDDDTTTTPTFENAVSQETSESTHYLFGYALPRFPSGNEIASFIVKHAPCFWCRRERHLSLTSRSISLRLIFLNAIFGLVQAASASYLLVVLFSNKLVNRNAEHVDNGTDYTSVSPNLWSINGSVMLAGFLGTIAFFLMICSRPAIRDVNLVGSVRFMWCMMWLVPLEIYVTISMFGMRLQVCMDIHVPEGRCISPVTCFPCLFL